MRDKEAHCRETAGGKHIGRVTEVQFLKLCLMFCLCLRKCVKDFHSRDIISIELKWDT